MITDSGSGKTNALLNLINNQKYLNRIHLYAKDPYEANNQYLINKLGKVGLKHYDDPRSFLELKWYTECL